MFTYLLARVKDLWTLQQIGIGDYPRLTLFVHHTFGSYQAKSHSDFRKPTMVWQISNRFPLTGAKNESLSSAYTLVTGFSVCF